MKKHLFASGEIIYQKNIKELPEGSFSAEFIKYDNVAEDTLYEAIGQIGEKAATVEFMIRKECYEDLSFKSMIKILMQSDLIQSDWEKYSIKFL